MKNNMMKKLLTLTLACAMPLSLAACGSKAESPADSSADQNTAAPTETDAKTYKIAVIKQLDHASLDEIANAVTAELDQISADKNVKIEYEVTSGQGDQTILKQLSDQAIADGVDAIIPIATKYKTGFIILPPFSPALPENLCKGNGPGVASAGFSSRCNCFQSVPFPFNSFHSFSFLHCHAMLS